MRQYSRDYFCSQLLFIVIVNSVLFWHPKVNNLLPTGFYSRCLNKLIHQCIIYLECTTEFIGYLHTQNLHFPPKCIHYSVFSYTNHINQSHNQLLSVVFYEVGTSDIDIFYKNKKILKYAVISVTIYLPVITWSYCGALIATDLVVYKKNKVPILQNY